MRTTLIGIGASCADSAKALAEDADALVVATGWPEYRSWPWPETAASMRTPLVSDGRTCPDQTTPVASGFQYVSIGR